MRCGAAIFVPRILTAEQKEWRMSVATNMLQGAESDENFMGQSSLATRRGSTGMTRT